MDMVTALQKRGAVNVEYILLVVVGALAVVLGLGMLGSAMNSKHEAVANALNGKGVPSIGVVVAGSGILKNAAITEDTITWEGGKAPFRVLRSPIPDMSIGQPVGTTPDHSIVIEPETGSAWYQIIDDDDKTTDMVLVQRAGLAASVTSVDDGAPLDGVLVEIVAVDIPAINLTTSYDGMATFHGLRAGTYTVTASKSGYVTQVTEVTLAGEDFPLWNFALVTP